MERHRFDSPYLWSARLIAGLGVVEAVITSHGSGKPGDQ